jgi:predicted AAA+ superfamily ATPase
MRMLVRKAMKRLKSWKTSAEKKALLVTGARQVGKTFLIRRFAEEHYNRFIEFNLIENTEARRSFSNAVSADDLMLRVSVASQEKLIPNETLIFFDEVQTAPEIASMIKFLVEKTNYDFVLSGSLLGVELENIRSWPVGYITEVRMYPLDFEEFTWASGLGESEYALVKNAIVDRCPVPGFLHERLTALFHRYLLVGGLPGPVSTFFSTNSIDAVRSSQNDIVTFYKKDISQYAKKDRRITIVNIFDLIPTELASQNRRFRLSSIENVKRYTDVMNEFLWLTNAGVAVAVYNIKAPISPLLLSENHSIFKLFMCDVGLLTGRYPKNYTLGLLDGKPESGMGSVYENFVAQEIVANGLQPRYFSKKKIGEIDFVTEDSTGKITAIEVKSGKNYKTHAALSNALRVDEYRIDQAVVLAETNVEIRGDMVYMPVYAAGLINIYYSTS